MFSFPELVCGGGERGGRVLWEGGTYGLESTYKNNPPPKKKDGLEVTDRQTRWSWVTLVSVLVR